MIDVAGIVVGNGGDRFVVVFFDVVGDAVRILMSSMKRVRPSFPPMPTVPPKIAATKITTVAVIANLLSIHTSK